MTKPSTGLTASTSIRTLNFHRPCGVLEIRTFAKGKTKRVYHWYDIQWEILRQLPDVARFLRPDLTVQQLVL